MLFFNQDMYMYGPFEQWSNTIVLFYVEFLHQFKGV